MPLLLPQSLYHKDLKEAGQVAIQIDLTLWNYLIILSMNIQDRKTLIRHILFKLLQQQRVEQVWHYERQQACYQTIQCLHLD